jgi:hypothetical protein
MPQAGFEPAIPATKRLHTYVLDCAATGIGTLRHSCTNFTRILEAQGCPGLVANAGEKRHAVQNPFSRQLGCAEEGYVPESDLALAPWNSPDPPEAWMI